ncbi:MAG: TlpA family protein disulfide reductase, partial [Bacteroidales bacterium]|nr:TlpA family protein disulfide reductase [Bacteroidales bacterium]
IDLPILYENPAYMNLFQHLFERYLFNYDITNEQRPEIESSLLNNNFKKLFESFNLIGNTTNSNLKELVLLKEIHDGLYTNYYPRRNLIQILDSIFFYSQIAEHKYIAQNIREKITRLLPGFKPPDFSLRDEDSIYYSLSDFRGKFVYLCFCNIQSLSCIKEFNILDSLQQRYKEYLYVIMISVDENFENTIYYKEKKQLDLNFFHYGNNPIILKKYNVKAFPTYYLIDPDGKLILSPAPSPSQDFEIKLFQILRSNGFL